MAEQFDARGLACPAPVLMAKKALEESNLNEIEIIVDNEASMENVSRFLGSRSFKVEVGKKGTDFIISGRSDGTSADSVRSAAALTDPQIVCVEGGDIAPAQKIMIVAATDRMGFGDDELGKKLMINFIKTISEMGDDLWRLVFVNNGVKLAVEGSPVLEDLLKYEASGIKIMVCGTCLTHFNLLDSKKVGETTNMLDIVTAMQLADKVIQI